MKEIIFRTEKGSYRWRPTKWMKAVGYTLTTVFTLGGIYAWILLLYDIQQYGW